MAKDAVARLDPRVKECQAKIEAISGLMKDHNERKNAQQAVQDAKDKVTEFEAQISKAEALEESFKQPAEGESNGVSVEALESEVARAQQMASSCKTTISMKKLSVKRLSEASSAPATEQLLQLVATVDGHSKKLNALRQRVIEWKKAGLRLGVK